MNTGSRYLFAPFRLALTAAVLYTCTFIHAAAATEIVAHRGGYFLAPENTCAAFRSCSGLVDRIEMDVRTSADGALLLMHDDTVIRTTVGYAALTNDSGVVLTNVADLTLEQLKTLDAGSKFSRAFTGETVPTFVEALRSLPPGIPAMVHMKACSPTSVVETLRAENALSNVIVYCDSWNPLFAVHQLDPGIQLCAGGSGALPTNTLAMLKRNGILSVGWNTPDVTQELVDRVHLYDMMIHAASDGPATLPLLDMGVDRILVASPWLGTAMAKSTPSSNPQLARDLVAYWKLDDGLLSPDATTADDVETNSPGRLIGFDSPPAWISGDDARAGGALLLDGVNDYVRMPTNEALNIGTNAVTLSLWVKLSVLPSQLSNGFSCIYDDLEKDAYTMYMEKGSKELRFKITDASLQAARPGIPEAHLTTGVWHHVVGVYNGSASPSAGQALIYLDGFLQDVHTGGDGSSNLGLVNLVRRGQAASIGRNGTENNYYFGGAVDDIAIWRRALSPAEVRQIYIAGTNGIPLERKVMTIWITNVYPDLDTGDMEMDVRVEHGCMTNEPLRLRGAILSTGTYTDQTVLEGGHGHMANFRVPQSHLHGPSGARSFDRPSFFQLACP